MTTEPQAPAAAPVRVVPPLHPKLLLLDMAGQVVAIWSAAVPAGVTYDDVLKPEYWAHVAGRLKPLAMIRVFPEDGTWEAELRVRNVGNQWAKVSPIRHVEWPVDILAQSAGFDVVWRGPHQKWCIVRKVDNEIVDKEIVTKEAAYARLPELMRRAA